MQEYGTRVIKSTSFEFNYLKNDRGNILKNKSKYRQSGYGSINIQMYR